MCFAHFEPTGCGLKFVSVIISQNTLKIDLLTIKFGRRVALGSMYYRARHHQALGKVDSLLRPMQPHAGCCLFRYYHDRLILLLCIQTLISQSRIIITLIVR